MRLRRIVVAYAENGQKMTCEFLTLHAAVRHFKLDKAAVRDAIHNHRGKLGNFDFPVGLAMGETRYLFNEKIRRRRK
jgi:hypothetical protein